MKTSISNGKKTLAIAASIFMAMLVVFPPHASAAFDAYLNLSTPTRSVAPGISDIASIVFSLMLVR